MSRDSLHDLTDGVEVEFIKEADLSFHVHDGKTTVVWQGNTVMKRFFLSKEYVEVSHDGQGRRVFTAPQWYWEKIGIDLT